MWMTRMLWSVVVAMGVGILASTGHSEESKGVIGIQLPLTGPVASWGSDCKAGIEMARKELPQPLRDRVTWMYEDDQVTPKLALSVSRKFLRDPHLLALVTFSTNVALAVSPIAASKRVPMLALSGDPGLLKGNPDIYDHWPDRVSEVRYYLDFLKERNPERVAILTFEHDYTLALRELFIAGAREQGRKFVVDEMISGGHDLRSLISRITQQQADFIFLNVFEPDFSMIVKSLRQHRYFGTILTFAGNITNDFFAAVSPEVSSGITFFSLNYRHPSFLREVEQLTVKPHDLGGVFSCYVGAKRLVAALIAAERKGALSMEGVRASLGEVQSVSVDGHEFGARDRRFQFDFIRGESLNGKAVFE